MSPEEVFHRIFHSCWMGNIESARAREFWFDLFINDRMFRLYFEMESSIVDDQYYWKDGLAPTDEQLVEFFLREE